MGSINGYSYDYVRDAIEEVYYEWTQKAEKENIYDVHGRYKDNYIKALNRLFLIALNKNA
jgi:hypothetical protein